VESTNFISDFLEEWWGRQASASAIAAAGLIYRKGRFIVEKCRVYKVLE
jgi:hypothetical protein